MQKIESELELNILMRVSWIIVNLTCGDKTSLKRIERNGLIDTLKSAFVKFTCIHGSLGAQFLWALSNFVAERKSYRDQIIQDRFVDLVVTTYEQSEHKQELLPDTVYFISSCLRVYPYPLFTQVRRGISLLINTFNMIVPNLNQENSQ